jgi:diadenosine tetraphosphate (Ap4A) HIT family hydrolase
MIAAARRLAEALRRSGLPCEGVNLLLADGVAAGQSVFHCHLHVIPRTSQDGFGFRRPLGVGRDASRPTREATAERIRACLES